MSLYNRSDAVRYAKLWAPNHNPFFPNYGGLDCTNFVSQCLWSGGWPMIALPGGMGWWSGGEKSSRTWCNAQHFCDYMEEYRIAVECKREELIPGDIVTEVYMGRDNHVMFVTGIGSGSDRDILYSAHSNTRLDYSLAKVEAEDHRRHRFWKVMDVVRTRDTGTFTRSVENSIIQGARR